MVIKSIFAVSPSYVSSMRKRRPCRWQNPTVFSNRGATATWSLPKSSAAYTFLSVRIAELSSTEERPVMW